MKRIMLIFGPMLLFAFGAFCQIQGGVDDRKAKGVPNTTVTATDLRGKVVATVASDDSGFYEFKGLKPGKYKIEAKAAGFRPAVYKIVVHEGDTGAVEGADDLYQGTLLDITLSTDMLPSKIEGVVIDQKEKGLPNMTITATDANDKVVATVKSDGLGFYAFKGLRPGKYKIEAKATGFRPALYRIVVNEGESEDELVDINQGTWLYIVLAPVRNPK